MGTFLLGVEMFNKVSISYEKKKSKPVRKHEKIIINKKLRGCPSVETAKAIYEN